MFVDLVGSTALSERLDPEEMRDVLRAYQNTVTGEISRLEGFTAKLMGDGVLAYFGWPRTHEDEAERAVRAGLAVVGAVARLPNAAGKALAARVGIATGLVVVGDLVGEERRRSRRWWGIRRISRRACKRRLNRAWLSLPMPPGGCSAIYSRCVSSAH